MNLIDTPFELLNPKDFDQVITELQAAKRELAEALNSATEAIIKLNKFVNIGEVDDGVADLSLIADKYKVKTQKNCKTCSHYHELWDEEPCASCGSGEIGGMVYTDNYEAKT